MDYTYTYNQGVRHMMITRGVDENTAKMMAWTAGPAVIDEEIRQNQVYCWVDEHNQLQFGDSPVLLQDTMVVNFDAEGNAEIQHMDGYMLKGKKEQPWEQLAMLLHNMACEAIAAEE